MLDSISRERLQPSLLDRLTDDIKGIESDIGRLRSMLPKLDEAQRAALAGLLDPDATGLPHEAALAPFAALGPMVVEQVKRLVGLEQRRQGEIRSRFVLSTERLRACVLRDLTWLLNTPNLRWRDGRAEDSQLGVVPDIEAYPRAAASVVNYGIPPLSGRTGLDPPAVANVAPTTVPPPAKGLKTTPSDVDRTAGPPVTATFPPLVFPALERGTLANGAKVVLARRPGLPLVQLTVQVADAGFTSDPAGKPGTAAFAMGMLDEGAGSYGALALGDRTEALGAILSTGASFDGASLYLSALTKNLEPSLALLADVLLRPTFDANEIERVRAQWLAGLKQEKARPGSLARRAIYPLLYGAGHPYATAPSGTGTEASIAGLTQAELKAWVAARLRPDRATVIVVGDVTLADVTAKLDAALAGWKAPGVAAPATALPAVPLPKQPRVFLIDQPGAVQATILVAQLVPPSTDAGATPLEIANAVLGGEFGSRLNMNLREAKHWAYGAYSGVSDALGPRPWIASASVQIDKTAESAKELDREIREYATAARPPLPAELTKIQATEVRGLPGSYETAGAVLGTLTGIVRFGRPDDWAAKRAAAVSALTPAQVQAAAAAIKPAALTWVIVGDLAKIESGVRALKLGDVKVLDADGKVVR